MELGAAQPDGGSIELDFTASRGNIVFSNTIRGNHYSGIFLAADSDQNDILNNVILDALSWALAAAKQMPNKSLDNLTDLPSRNIGSGLDPALIRQRPAGERSASPVTRRATIVPYVPGP
ncbi:MAG: hypothetical protein M3N54_05500 [Acidobacteriota bacterium]|nr:hypothetical protein [Acidobacteriota bacterium]